MTESGALSLSIASCAHTDAGIYANLFGPGITFAMALLPLLICALVMRAPLESRCSEEPNFVFPSAAGHERVIPP